MMIHQRLARRPVVALVVAALTLMTIVHLGHHMDRRSRPCRGWDPDGDEADDPPGCHRAVQYRQLERFLNSPQPGYEYPDHTMAIVRQLVPLLRNTEGHERPLIVATWFFAYGGRVGGGTAGEEVWMKDVIEEVEREGFVVLDYFMAAPMMHLIRSLSESIHMVWMNDNNVVECVSNPHCIAPADYRPAENITLRHDVSGIPSHELGVIPLWRLHCTTWWGSRPTNIPRPGGNSMEIWNIPNRGGEEVWSFNPLGRMWNISPFPYPGHTWVPITMEGECAKERVVPHEERNQSILVMGKQMAAIHPQSDIVTYDFKYVLNRLREAGIEHPDLLSTFNLETADFAGGNDVPQEFINMGQLPREQFSELLGSIGVLLGIILPVISPTPYLALCRGTPVVMPYRGQHDEEHTAHPDISQWVAYSPHWQHGPISSLPEPYVYNYELGNMDALSDALIKAIKTPIEPYVPQGFTVKDQLKGVHDMLYADYQGEYHRVREKNGGVSPRIPVHMLDACWAHDRCYFGAEPDDYLYD